MRMRPPTKGSRHTSLGSNGAPLQVMVDGYVVAEYESVVGKSGSCILVLVGDEVTRDFYRKEMGLTPG